MGQADRGVKPTSRWNGSICHPFPWNVSNYFCFARQTQQIVGQCYFHQISMTGGDGNVIHLARSSYNVTTLVTSNVMLSFLSKKEYIHLLDERLFTSINEWKKYLTGTPVYLEVVTIYIYSVNAYLQVYMNDKILTSTHVSNSLSKFAADSLHGIKLNIAITIKPKVATWSKIIKSTPRLRLAQPTKMYNHLNYNLHQRYIMLIHHWKSCKKLDINEIKEQCFNKKRGCTMKNL